MSGKKQEKFEFEKIFGQAFSVQKHDEESIDENSITTTTEEIHLNQILVATVSSCVQEEDNENSQTHQILFYCNNLCIIHDSYNSTILANNEAVLNEYADLRAPDARYIWLLKQVATHIATIVPAAAEYAFDLLLKYLFEAMKLSATYNALFQFKEYFNRNKHKLGLYTSLKRKKEDTGHENTGYDSKDWYTLVLDEKPLLRLKHASEGPTFSSLGYKTVTLEVLSLIDDPNADDSTNPHSLLLEVILNHYTHSSATFSLRTGSSAQEFRFSLSDVVGNQVLQSNRTRVLENRSDWSDGLKFLTDFMNVIKLPQEYRNKYFWKYLLKEVRVVGFDTVFEHMSGEARKMENTSISLFFDLFGLEFRYNLLAKAEKRIMCDLTIVLGSEDFHKKEFI